MNWDHTYDVVIAGTGGASFAAALTAADKGLKVLMVESSDRWGGSTSMSGGGMWLPDNPLMQRDKAGDSREEALRYMDLTIGDAGPGATKQRQEAFVDNIESFVLMAERLGMEFARAAEYPDYYPEKPGGKVGRAIEGVPFDVKKIGDWWETSRGQDGVPAPAMTDDFWLLQRGWSSVSGMARGAAVMGRLAKMLVTRKKLVGMGAALASQFLHAALKLGVDVWLNAPLEEFIVEEGKVTGVRTTRDGHAVTIQATRGVILGTGGFDHNAEMRQKYQGVDGTWSSGSKSNLGSPIELAEQLGAAIDLMDDAWWGGSIPAATPEMNPSFLVSERSVPYTIIVDSQGNRFANESESYVDLGHHMFEHLKKVPGKFWMIADARHTRLFMRSYAVMPGALKAMKEAGIYFKAPTLSELATEIGVDSQALRATVERFNGFARTGIDQDFGRGNSVYDRYYSHPLVKPNPNLGALEKGPYTAVEIVPGDLGTKGGIVTDEYARALRPDGTVIDGLYAAGNCSASVMGRTYPGPGSTIGPACVFGHIAAKHLAD